jgi:hypothetical protein
LPVSAKHANDYLRLAAVVESSNVEIAWQDHRKPTHPLTFSETDALVKQLITTRRDLLITPDYSKTPPRSAAFRLTDSDVVLSLLGYC